MLEWIEGESFGLFRPDLADVFVRREPFEGLEALGEVVGADEVGEMAAELIVGFMVEALDSRLLDGAVHVLDLTVGPGMLGPGEAVIDIVARARHHKSGGQKGSPRASMPRSEPGGADATP